MAKSISRILEKEREKKIEMVVVVVVKKSAMEGNKQKGREFRER